MVNEDVDEGGPMPFRKRHSLRFEIEPQQQQVEELQQQPQEQVEELQQQQVEELPIRFKEKILKMDGTEETLIIKKTLTKTDVDGGESRLSLPMSSLLTHNFLTSDEKVKIENRIKGDREGGLTVEVIDPNLKVWELKMRRCDMKKKTKKGKREKTSSMYLLAYKWNHVVNANSNSLKQGAELQLWSFRSRRKLCLALVFASLGN